METIEEFETFVRDRVVALHMGLPQKISARKLSYAIGQSAGYINALENRNGFPSMQVFFYICEYLGVTPAEFFEEGNRYPGEYQEILSDLKHLDQTNLQNVKAIVKGLAHKDK